MSDHTHDLVGVLSADGTEIHDTCRTCPYRSDPYPAPPEPTEDELAEMKARAAADPNADLRGPTEADTEREDLI